MAMNPIIKFTTLFGLLAVELAIEMEPRRRASVLAAVFFLISTVFVCRSFYGMRIPAEAHALTQGCQAGRYFRGAPRFPLLLPISASSLLASPGRATPPPADRARPSGRTGPGRSRIAVIRHGVARAWSPSNLLGIGLERADPPRLRYRGDGSPRPPAASGRRPPRCRSSGRRRTMPKPPNMNL